MKIETFVLRKSSLIFIAGAGFVCCMAPSHAASVSLSHTDRLYLSHRPLVGEVYVVDIREEPFERKVLASTLQGIVNHKYARIYLLDGVPGGMRPWETSNEREAALFWLDFYQKRYGIKKAWEGTLDEALKMFASEVKGYILVSRDEPWTINAGTTLASIKNALVAYESDRKELESLGLRLVESLSGRWTNGSACYADLHREFYSRMKHRGVANVSPLEYRVRDFVIQQGILTVYARPTTKEWATVKHILHLLPANQPVYGYPAQTGEEEFFAVKGISEENKFLVPTDSTPNLSFHVAVVPESKSKQKLPPPEENTSCPKDKLNVAVAITDGDNLVTPIDRYAWPTFWQSPRRGELPVGWSMSLALFTIAPAAAEYYVSTATENDELVGMLGIGYSLPFYYPQRDFFLSKSFEVLREKNFPTYWVLDVPLLNKKSRVWSDFTANVVSGYPSGILLGYIGVGASRFFRTAGGLPVIIAANAYLDTPEIIARRIRSFLKQTGSPRPPVVFLSASSWMNPLEDLVSALKPLQSEGVNFLLPSEAFGCVP